MGAIPTQRETASRASEAPAHAGETPVPAQEGPVSEETAPCAEAHAPGDARACATLPGSSLAPGAARTLVRRALTEWTGLGLPGAEHLTDRLADDAALVVSELVTNAVVHAGTDVEMECRLEGDDPDTAALVVEVSDHHPSRAPRGSEPETPHDTPEHGRGLRLVGALSEAWGITYRTGRKTIWARLPAGGCATGEQIEAYAGEHALVVGLRVAEILAPEPLPGDEAGEAAGSWRGVGEPWDLREAGETWDSREGGEARDWPDPQGTHGLRDWNDLRDWRDRHENREGRNGPDGAWLGRGALSFLAEASDLLAGQLDEDLVAALAGQLIVPRLADWCAVWLEDEATGGGWSGGAGAGGPRLARVWHGSENRIEELRGVLEKDPPRPFDPTGASPFEHSRERGRSGPVDYPWPGGALDDGEPGAALAYRLVAGGRPLGTLVIGRSGKAGFPDEITGLVEDLSRRVALAIGAARQYARQATISAVLQRGLLPGAVAEIPGMRSALVYEPCDKGGPSGDFYDLFPAGDGRWCFAVGDVQGKGPEAAVVIGLARPWLRLLAREGYRVADVLDRLNQLLLDDATEAADAAARALVAAGARPTPPGDGPQTRFLSLLYGELVPFDGGVRCTVASAGHPLPLLLGAGGEVHTAARPQTLLGVVEDATYTSETFELRSGDTLLCVTDGVTERRSGSRQFDDGDGLAAALAGCAGLDAELIAERIKRLVHEFGARPPADDLALLVLQAD
ncbi:SpoIIE family protein phosphatase [Streptomyces cahuitamycinicus]|uniref:Protein phosphatase n=1 Tax=Streptomyces cahuitamycinicus TaxID=2070367 RepID=A0A2N8TJU3_9ACTN|nr:SpoIIE family protein phosphatase [Streptomyces cahuitamycinicus]PNG19282.1 protein phosphatase [Streptomyces cahuitamycinicus]